MPGIKELRKLLYSSSSKGVPRNKENMSSRYLKKRMGLILKPWVARWSNFMRKMFARDGLQLRPMLQPLICLKILLLKVKSLE